MIRTFDVVLSVLGLVLGLPILTLLFMAGFLDTRSPIFKQVRVGRHQKPFTLIKFRTMRKGTASVASHMADPSAITAYGRFLRRTKLDELPQLWNVLTGEMSLVGPRPCLLGQKELISERQIRGVFEARPGITGVAQLSGIDMSTPTLLAEADAKMLIELDVSLYFSLIVRTILGRGSGDRVRKDQIIKESGTNGQR